MRIIITIILLFHSAFAFTQVNEKIVSYDNLDDKSRRKYDSLLFIQAPFDSALAKEDIIKGYVRILRLFNSLGEPMNTNSEHAIVEERFGFEFFFKESIVPDKYLIERREEYNSVVYRYLDSLHSIDTKSEIDRHLKTYVINRIMESSSDKELWKSCKRQFRQEKKSVKILICDANKLFRNQSYELAAQVYKQVQSKQINRETQDYTNSRIYDCFINLEKYDEAIEIRRLTIK